MPPRLLLPLLALLAGLVFLSSSACGIFTAPVSIPSAIAENHNAQLEGTITTADGTPLSDVTLTVRKTHAYWDAVMGTVNKYEDSSTLVSEKFSVWRRGNSKVQLIFTKPGYLPAMVEFDATTLSVTNAATTQPNAPDASHVPDTQPARQYGYIFISPRLGPNPNPTYLDPAWAPGLPVRIIMYPVQPSTIPAAEP